MELLPGKFKWVGKAASAFLNPDHDPDMNETIGNISYHHSFRSSDEGIVDVIAFYGSNDSIDWFRNLICRKTGAAEGSGKVHRGFVDQWLDIESDFLMNCLSAGMQQVVILGHSLGGAMAVQAAHALTAAGVEVKLVFTVGCPRIGNRTFASSTERKFRVVNLISSSDIVPSTPPAILGFARPGVDLYQRSGLDSPAKRRKVLDLIKAVLKLRLVRSHFVSNYGRIINDYL